MPIYVERRHPSDVTADRLEKELTNPANEWTQLERDAAHLVIHTLRIFAGAKYAGDEDE